MVCRPVWGSGVVLSSFPPSAFCLCPADPRTERTIRIIRQSPVCAVPLSPGKPPFDFKQWEEEEGERDGADKGGSEEEPEGRGRLLLHRLLLVDEPPLGYNRDLELEDLFRPRKEDESEVPLSYLMTRRALIIIFRCLVTV